MSTHAVGKLFDREPPHSLESEMALLGSMILDPSCIPAVAEVVPGREAFYSQSHAYIYASLIGVYRRTGTADLVQLLESLRDFKALDMIGGPDYLAELATTTPSAANHPHFAQIVADKHTLRKIIQAAGDSLYAAYHPGDRPAHEIADEAVAAITGAATGSAVAKDVTLADAMRDAFGRMSRGVSDIMPTGIHAIDQAIGGIPKVGLTTVIGRPSHFKSGLVAEIVRRLCLHGGVPGRMFSFEMPSTAIAENILSAETGVPMRTIRRYGTDPGMDQCRDIEAAIKLADGADFSLVEELVDANNIATKCARYAKRGVKLVVVDYLQNLPDLPNERDRIQSLSKTCGILQRVAIRHKMSVILVSQADKASVQRDGPLGLADAFGGATVQQVTDLGLSVYCPSKAGREDAPEDLVEVHVVKNKYGPLASAIELRVNFEIGRVR